MHEFGGKKAAEAFRGDNSQSSYFIVYLQLDMHDECSPINEKCAEIPGSPKWELAPWLRSPALCCQSPSSNQLSDR